jgi:hypothetical protein
VRVAGVTSDSPPCQTVIVVKTGTRLMERYINLESGEVYYVDPMTHQTMCARRARGCLCTGWLVVCLPHCGPAGVPCSTQRAGFGVVDMCLR